LYVPAGKEYQALTSYIRRMEDEFDLPVLFRGEEKSFKARLLLYGYSYKIQVIVEGQTILFEPDEERNWRALIDTEDTEKHKPVNVELLQSIAGSLDSLTK
jgi:hypothetical protein